MPDTAARPDAGITRLGRLAGPRLLGVGLAAALSAVTIALWLTGDLGLYVNPASTAFAVSMAFVALVGCAASFALPLGAEEDHGHDHGDAHSHASSAGRNRPGTAATTTTTTTNPSTHRAGRGGRRRR